MANMLGAWTRKEQPVYMVDCRCFKPPEEYRVDIAGEISATQEQPGGAPGKAGGRHAYLPPGIHPKLCGGKPVTDLAACYKECHSVVTSAIEELLNKTGLCFDDFNIVVTSCSVYCPTPSMASLVMNHFKGSGATHSYHLGGMGSSAGVLGINFVYDLLQAHPNSNALFVTTETTTIIYYQGSDPAFKERQVPVHMGAAAVLLTNKAASAWRAKYKLLQHVRVHMGQRQEAYNAMQYTPDKAGVCGMLLRKELVKEAEQALDTALQSVAQQAGKTSASICQSVRHFLIHADSEEMVRAIGKKLQLSDMALAPSLAVLHYYGNLCGSGTWYALTYLETVPGVVAGDQLLQVALGSGIKCGINLWQAQRTIHDVHTVWETHVPAGQPRTVAQAARQTMRAAYGGAAAVGGWACQVAGAMQGMVPLLLVATLLLWLLLLALRHAYLKGASDALGKSILQDTEL